MTLADPQESVACCARLESELAGAKDEIKDLKVGMMVPNQNTLRGRTSRCKCYHSMRTHVPSQIFILCCM